jgi:hypothetical protein
MLWKQAALGDERAFMTIKNMPGNAQSLTTGWPIQLALGTAGASFDGTQAITTVALTGGGTFIGVAYKDIGANAYGAIQTYGNCASVLLSNVGSSITINAGDPLVPGPAGFFSAAPTYANSGFRFVLASAVPPAVSGSAYCSGWVRTV